MISGLKPTALLFRDGTSQADRLNAALDPQHIPVDERTTADLVRFAQAFAGKLRFFEVLTIGENQELRPNETWEGFLVDNYDHYKGQSPEEQKRLRENWISGLMDYVSDPAKYANDPEAQTRFGRPHVALFVTFLQLLGVIREQLNGFTGQHLDFYYKQVLGLEERKPVPDMVNLIIQLSGQVNDYLLEKGTQFSAGKDATGKELVYTALEDTLITRAAVSNVRNVFTEKKVTDIRTARENNSTEPDAGLLNMLQMAVGDPAPSDPLPPYNGQPFSVAALGADYKNPATQATAIAYAQDSMFLSEQGLRSILNLDVSSSEPEWEGGYALMDAAYKAKVHSIRRKDLQRLREADPKNGFMTMLQYALGNPLPGDNLPDYKNMPVGLNELVALNTELAESNDPSAALRYVRESLLLKEQSFKQLMDAQANPATGEWETVYTNLEAAQTQKRNFQAPPPVIEAYTNIYSVDDAYAGVFSLKDEKADDRRFKTFGKGTLATGTGAATPATLGFAVASPQLWLTEGERTIALTLEFRNVPDSLKIAGLLKDVFRFFLSGKDAWQQAVPQQPVFRDVKATQTESRKIFFDAKLVLSANAPAVTPPGTSGQFPHFESDAPVLAILLNNAEKAEDTSLPYPQLKDLLLERVTVNVEVSSLKALTLQNDSTAPDPKKPFEPFGFRPATDNSLYFAHPEISMKRLDALTLHFDWMKPPKKFSDYYAGYATIGALQPPLGIPSSLTNADFKASLNMKDRNTIVPVTDITLFNADDATVEQSVTTVLSDALKTSAPVFRYERMHWPDTKRPLFEWPRYFSLQLGAPDFQHDVYPGLLTRQAFLPSTTENAALKQLVLNPPYTPKLKGFSISYKASFTINLEVKNNAEDRIFHLHPFGYRALVTDGEPGRPAEVTLLPDYMNEGELYIGIADAVEKQRLSILFKMAEGSANPDIRKPDISWSYLAISGWKAFPAGSFVSDETDGLLNTGVVLLSLPEDATQHNTLMEAGMHWIRATVRANSAAVSDTVDIRAQAVRAVFTDNGNDPAHLLNLLAPEQVKGPVRTIPQISEVLQPYASSKGKPAESGTGFYNRISERLRHKDRAVTMWDYERIVLDRFPEVHKVKCVPGDFSATAENYGRVDVIVVPDIKGKLPFNPYEPKVSSDLLEQISAHLERRTPAFADVSVRNAVFVQVKTRFTVKFTESGNEQFLTRRLEDELKRYLAPWAFDDGADIAIGGKIYASMLVNFIAERSYVEYVAGIKLFSSKDGRVFTESHPENGDEASVQASQPDVILVSATSHIIDVVTEKGFEQKDFTGINYMKIELDFSIA